MYGDTTVIRGLARQLRRAGDLDPRRGRLAGRARGGLPLVGLGRRRDARPEPGAGRRPAARCARPRRGRGCARPPRRPGRRGQGPHRRRRAKGGRTGAAARDRLAGTSAAWSETPWATCPIAAMRSWPASCRRHPDIRPGWTSTCRGCTDDAVGLALDGRPPRPPDRLATLPRRCPLEPVRSRAPGARRHRPCRGTARRAPRHLARRGPRRRRRGRGSRRAAAADPSSELETAGLLDVRRRAARRGRRARWRASPHPGCSSRSTSASATSGAARSRRFKSWQRLRAGRVTTLSTAGGPSVELAWWPDSRYPAELARIATVPPGRPGRWWRPQGVVTPPDELSLPYELLLGSGGAIRCGTRRPAGRPGRTVRRAGHRPRGRTGRRGDGAVAEQVRLLHSGTAGRLRVTVAGAAAGGRRTLGIVSWMLTADGWRELRPFTRDAVPMVRVVASGPTTSAPPSPGWSRGCGHERDT